MGLPPYKALLGFPFYGKYFTTDLNGGCDKNPIGCNMVLLEDPTDGSDLGKSGAVIFSGDYSSLPSYAAPSYRKAAAASKADKHGGGQYYWDSDAQLFWTWDTPEFIEKKFSDIVKKYNLAGVFAWVLGADSEGYRLMKALSNCVTNAGRFSSGNQTAIPGSSSTTAPGS